MGTLAPQLINQEQYLMQERQRAEKHEYENGQLTLMGGASLAHVRIVRNLLTTLWMQSQKISDLEILSNDMRVHSPQEEFYFYPDLIGVEGAPILLDDTFDNLTNPAFIVEVLSSGTEARDRAQKFEAYRSIPNFKEYILVSQQQAKVEGFYKNANQEWIIREPIIGLDQIFKFQHFELQLDLKLVFEQVDLA